MNDKRTSYVSPFSKRYASDKMQYLFSEEFKFRTWRQLWIYLAESEKDLGLSITDKQIEELKKFKDDINYEVAEKKEQEIRHDVMSHVHAFAEQAPDGGKIIHLGATSCFIGDNTDLIIMKEALHLVQTRLLKVIKNLSDFANEYKELPTLGFTHYQPAQLTTVGKRATLWLYDFFSDFNDITSRIDNLQARGVKGTTGTQASFVHLFDNDQEKVKKLDQTVCEKMGFKSAYPVTGQTYPRKLDMQILQVIAGIAQSAHRFATDIRLLSNLKEIEEPFGKKQIGSSAMAYKRNPMRSERICSLSRLVLSLSENPSYTAATQWMERTLDDSANKRISIAESFLAIDSILILLDNVTNGLIVNKGMIQRRISEELPFMITENLLMEGTNKGHSRQDLHEIIREHSHKAGAEVKSGGSNRLIEMLAQDKDFPLNEKEINQIIKKGNFTGRAASQVEDFLKTDIYPLFERFNNLSLDEVDVRI